MPSIKALWDASENHSDFRSGQLTHIRRQRRADYREAVVLAPQKQPEEAFAQLERMGAVSELSDDKLHSATAQAYVKALESNKSALMVAPTWAEIAAVTEKVRRALKASGGLAGEEKEFHVFDSMSWTEAQKRDARQYRPGLRLRFHRNKDGFAGGESAEVVSVRNGTLQLKGPGGSQRVFQLAQSSASFDVGESRTMKVAPDDKLLLQSNRQKQFVNGELVEVKAVQAHSLLLADGRVIPENYRTFTHGYVVTSHAAQRKTADEVILVASARSLPAVHQEQFYVRISRGRDRCRVFTDDAERLRSQVTHSSTRPAAIEVIPPAHQHKFISRILRLGRRLVKPIQHETKQTVAPLKGVTKRQTHHKTYGHHHNY